MDGSFSRTTYNGSSGITSETAYLLDVINGGRWWSTPTPPAYASLKSEINFPADTSNTGAWTALFKNVDYIDSDSQQRYIISPPTDPFPDLTEGWSKKRTQLKSSTAVPAKTMVPCLVIKRQRISGVTTDTCIGTQIFTIPKSGTYSDVWYSTDPAAPEVGDSVKTLLFPIWIAQANSTSSNAISSPVFKLRVGKMTEAGVLTGTFSTSTGDIDPAALDIDLDPDRFRIWIPAAKSLGAISVKVSTANNPVSSYDDDATQIDLNINPINGAYSEAMLLVSDDVDDMHEVNGIADDATGDRTHKIQLGGDLRIEEIKVGNGSWLTLNADTPVPVEKTLTFDVFRLKDEAGPNGMAVISTVGVETDLIIAQERYAQVGIKLDWTIYLVDPPVGVDLSDGLDEFTSAGSPTAEEVALFNASYVTPANSDLQVFYVNYLARSNGESFRPSLFNAPVSSNVIISAHFRLPYTLPHELGHILTDSGHVSPTINLMREGGTSSSETFGGSKRIDSSQETLMKASPYVQDP